MWVPFDDKVFFNTNSLGNNRYPWVTDGTTAGTLQLSNETLLVRYPYWNVPLGDDAVLFSTDGNGLWITDGTTAGTHEIGSDLAAYRLTPIGNLVYFVGYEAATGYEPWVSDGTTAGTHIIADINPGTDNGINYHSYDNSELAEFHEAGGYIYFMGEDGTYGEELWRTDGTAAGTERLTDLIPSGESGVVRFLGSTGDRIIFYYTVSATSTFGGTMATDGTTTEMLLDYADTRDPHLYRELNGSVYFNAEDSSSNEDIWVTDGTVAGTIPLGVYDALGPTSYVRETVPFHGGLALQVENSHDTDTLIWYTDGTTAGTGLIADVFSVAGVFTPELLAGSATTLFFVAEDVHGTALWKLTLE